MGIWSQWSLLLSRSALALKSTDEAWEGPALQFPSECAARSCRGVNEFSRPLASTLCGSAVLIPGPLFGAPLMLQVVVTVLAHPHWGGDFQTLDFRLEATAPEERNMKSITGGRGLFTHSFVRFPESSGQNFLKKTIIEPFKTFNHQQ